MSAYYQIGQNAAGIAVRIDIAPRPITAVDIRFARHVEPRDCGMPTLCRVWVGGPTFNMGEGRIVRPRRAALELAGVSLPEYERMPMVCGTRDCLALSHMVIEL